MRHMRFYQGNKRLEDYATLRAMCAVMAHRGPDGEGLYIADGIALGHRRPIEVKS